MKLAADLLKRIKGRDLKKNAGASLFDAYVNEMPSLQNAIDIVPGWSTCFPPTVNVKAGHLATYQDPRIQWAIECFGSLEGRKVLELGPLEGGHTLMLDRAGAQVEAIEANQLAFMRCLITKEIMGMSNTRFWLGDFVKWLENKTENYDLIIASGILYHLIDPLHLIDLISNRTKAVFLWTHVMSDEAMPLDDPRRIVFDQNIEETLFHGVNVRTYRRTYLNAETNPAFCGGMQDEHRWINRNDLILALGAVGFDDIRINHDEPQHQFGPALSIFAQKTAEISP
jgi:hypothetical protein